MRSPWAAPAIVALLFGVIAFAAGFAMRGRIERRPIVQTISDKPFAPTPDAEIPKDEFGKQVLLGRLIFTDTARRVPQFVGNDLNCSNCHLEAGRRANAAPLWAAYGMFPQYRAKNGHVNTFAERVQDCFKYSMNGKAPALGDPILLALESYAAFLAEGAPLGTRLPGRGYPKLASPILSGDYSRGRAVYDANCARCHGLDGAGQRADGRGQVPPLWGPRSFNWGAGMADIPSAAGFIAANMPRDHPGALTNQQAWDVATYVDGKPRPQDPRYSGSVAQTRAKFHLSGGSEYGQTVDGILLGANSEWR